MRFLFVAIAAPIFGKMIVPGGKVLAFSFLSVKADMVLTTEFIHLSLPGEFMSPTLKNGNS